MNVKLQTEDVVAKNRTKEERRRICDAWQQSGLTKTEFCLRNNLNLRSFKRWTKDIKKSVPSEDVVSDTKNIKFFPPVKSGLNSNIKQNCNHPDCKNFLEIMLPSGVSFKAHISENIITDFLKEVLR